jgi:hypothetical protein
MVVDIVENRQSYDVYHVDLVLKRQPQCSLHHQIHGTDGLR